MFTCYAKVLLQLSVSFDLTEFASAFSAFVKAKPLARLAVVSSTSICFATMATVAFEVGVVYKVITCTCGMKFHCVKTDNVELDKHSMVWRLFKHIDSDKENHTPTSWDDLAAAVTPHMVTPTRCTCYGRKDCSPEDDRRILCENCGRWFRRRIAGGSDSTMSHRDYSPRSSFSD